MALHVREGVVALLTCFTRKGGKNVYLLSLLRACFHVFGIGRDPSMNNIRSVPTMTTADSAAYFLPRLTSYTGVSCQTMRIAEGRQIVIFQCGRKSKFSEVIGADTLLVFSFRMYYKYYYCTKNMSTVTIFCREKSGQIQNELAQVPHTTRKYDIPGGYLHRK